MLSTCQEKNFIVADALSSSLLTYTKENTSRELECYLTIVMQGITASTCQMDDFKSATATDCKLQTFIMYIKKRFMGYRDKWHSHMPEYRIVISKSQNAELLELTTFLRLELELLCLVASALLS